MGRRKVPAELPCASLAPVGDIVLLTRHGFGNRIRSVASAWWLASEVDRRLQLVWQTNESCGARLEDLFDFRPQTGATTTDSLCVNSLVALSCAAVYQAVERGAVSGDRDFIPALLRTRERGKRVAVCSMRNSASLELSDPNAHVKDFDMLWLDDHLERFITPVHPDLQIQRPAMLSMLRDVLLDAVTEAGGTVGLLQLRAHLDQVHMHMLMQDSCSAHAHAVHMQGTCTCTCTCSAHAVHV